MKRCIFGLAFAFYLSQATPAFAQGDVIRSTKSGPWSAADTWEGGKLPGAGAKVQIREDHTVNYDANGGPVLRLVHVAGVLTFATDRDTRMDVCLLKIQPGTECTEDGFDCDAHFLEVDPAKNRAALLVGAPDNPISAKHRALIRLTYIDGLNKESLPALVCCGGRMELHGAPLSRTWVKLGATAKKGEATVVLTEPVTGWKAGDKVIVTASTGDQGSGGTRRPGRGDVEVQTEERTLQSIDGLKIVLDRPLAHDHSGSGDFRAAVANMSRNVIIESADPKGVRGHTMYHRGSSGAISYAEFRHLGKENVLGRYSIHYHLCGNTMRGSYVHGASIWDSHNRWVTIHGTNFLVVRDCVGYQSVGHGYFLEDGTEIYNVLDRNLAVQAFKGKRLPKQVLPFDANDGAGFWWANSLNSFTRNVACENDRYGYRFEATKTSAFKLTLPVLLPDSKREVVDIRTLPFIRFDDNEAHCDGLYGFNLGEGVDRFGPDRKHPFIIRNMKIWEIHYAFRVQSPCVLVENMHIHNAAYGVYHPNYDHHVYRNLTISNVISEPFNRGHDDDSIQYGPLAIDGMTFTSMRNNYVPMIQISDNNPFNVAETHIRNLKVIEPKDNNKRAIINLGGGPRPEPKTANCVPVYVHDYFGPGQHAKVISVKSRYLQSDGLDYKTKPPLTGDASRVAEVKGVEFPNLLDPVDDLPPGTVITLVKAAGQGKLLVRGTTMDNGTVKRVLVNGQEAKALEPNFAQWEATLDVQPGTVPIEAHAEDAAGNLERAVHRRLWRGE
ncbi:MAG: G8 domain-containing protein [Gemmataceae bacterium]|nr:G8 domain-containing protein [Gemmataceae bacterium]MCI0742042.1 G8 domain-containing protein [Gemmataceae bacterium]